MFKLFAIAATAGAIAGCVQRTQPPLTGAADARAQEAPLDANWPAGLRAIPASQPASPHADHNHAAEATPFTCPMHPEVLSDKPGTCPKCGMKLVAKTTAPAKGAP